MSRTLVERQDARRRPQRLLGKTLIPTIWSAAHAQEELESLSVASMEPTIWDTSAASAVPWLFTSASGRRTSVTSVTAIMDDFVVHQKDHCPSVPSVQPLCSLQVNAHSKSSIRRPVKSTTWDAVFARMWLICDLHMEWSANVSVFCGLFLQD